MNYEKHIWVSGEIIRSKQLNHIENGIYDEESRARIAEEALNTSISLNTSAINTLNANSSTPGSVDYKIAQATSQIGGYKVVADHTQVQNPSDKYIYLEPDDTATGNDKFREWIYYYDETQSAYVWRMTGDISLDLSNCVQKTDYASDQAFGIVKPDGTTITSNNGVLSAQAQSSGVSSFNGRTGAVSPQSGDYSYSDISGTPTLGTAAAKDVPTSGNASTTQVVMGDDTRLSDSRTPTSHTHTKSQITDFPTIPGGVKKGTTRAGATDTTLYFVYTT